MHLSPAIRIKRKKDISLIKESKTKEQMLRNMNRRQKRFIRMRPIQSRQMPSLTLTVAVNLVVQEASTSQDLDVLYVAV